MKYVLIVSCISLSFSCSINGGIAYSRQLPPSENQKPDPRVEIVIQELNGYLTKVAYKSVSSREELEKDIQSRLTRDARDPKIFPTLNTILADETNQNDQTFTYALNKAAWISMRSYIDKKCQELKLS